MILMPTLTLPLILFQTLTLALTAAKGVSCWPFAPLGVRSGLGVGRTVGMFVGRGEGRALELAVGGWGRRTEGGEATQTERERSRNAI